MRQTSVALYCLGIGLLIVCAAGCFSTGDTTAVSESVLQPISPGLETVQLDIVYVERDADDPLLSSLLWNDVDQVGTVDLETRSTLKEHGFRVGLVGLTPPRSLQRLLGLKNELTDAAGTSRHTDLIGRQTFLPNGGTTEIQTSTPVTAMKVKLPGDQEKSEIHLAHGVLRAEVERLQDGWIRLHLRPELHYGTSQLRPVAQETEFAYQGGQNVASYRDLEFSVEMNVGEMLIVSSDELSKGQLGENFFVNQEGARPRRYLVAIRLTDMKRIEPLYED